MGYIQGRGPGAFTQFRQIWDVTAPALKSLEERVVGITGPNPFDTGRESWTNVLFTLRTVTRVGGTILNAVRIYGSMFPTHFPQAAPAFRWESLCHWTSVPPVFPISLTRTPTVSSVDLDKGELPASPTPFPLQILPRYLLVGYTTNNVATSVRFQIRIQYLGLETEALQ